MSVLAPKSGQRSVCWLVLAAARALRRSLRRELDALCLPTLGLSLLYISLGVVFRRFGLRLRRLYF
jgi:hypothetical protein